MALYEPKWTFDDFIYFYFEWSHILWVGELDDEQTKSLLRLQSLVHAFGGKKFDLLTTESKHDMTFFVEKGLGMGHLPCYYDKILKLRRLIPHIFKYKEEFKNDPPFVIEFFTIIFDTLRLGYNYITAINETDGVDAERQLVCEYKRNVIDKWLDLKAKTLMDALKVLLGQVARKSFTEAELRVKYHFP